MDTTKDNDLPIGSAFTISGSNRRRRVNGVRPVQVKGAFEQPGSREEKPPVDRCPACLVGSLEPDCTLVTWLACLVLGPCCAPCFMQNRCPVCGYLGSGPCC
ncbi:uncharacterized protein LOC122262321 [Penaeus japonicus]|uniref:uncharacterized protein LOC122262321 n=1 Tax=Penaeus japonicus TaxID=27405 RepID=UPI001C717268|nr:uncharacterized protein LOC122262321 [Penaeus japonicus]